MSYVPSFLRFIYLRAESGEARHLRLGQQFCNWYIKQPWPELYHQQDADQATNMIEKWLTDHQYITELPPRVNQG